MVNPQDKSGQDRGVGNKSDGQTTKQDESSRQSARGQGNQQGDKPGGAAPSGIGSSQGQDSASPGKGKSRNEQSIVSDKSRNQSGSEESIVGDPTGAYKERYKSFRGRLLASRSRATPYTI